VRKHRTDSGLIRYDQRRESEWPQVAREIIAAERPKFVVMMIGNNDRKSIRQTASAPVSQPSPPAPAQASSAKPPDLQPVEQQQHSHPTPTQAGQAAYGQWEFQTEKWELAYIKRIDATIAALKSAGVPVIWVGLPSQRSTHATDDASYLNELYRSEAERGRHCLCGYMGRLCRRGWEVLATRTRLSRTDSPLTNERRRIFYQVRCT
jgi:hypothetical protein